MAPHVLTALEDISVAALQDSKENIAIKVFQSAIGCDWVNRNIAFAIELSLNPVHINQLKEQWMTKAFK